MVQSLQRPLRATEPHPDDVSRFVLRTQTHDDDLECYNEMADVEAGSDEPSAQNAHVDGAVGMPGLNKRWSAEPTMKPEELPEMRLRHWKT